MPLINALTFLLAIGRPPDHGWAVEALMKAHGIPGMSVAVIDDFKIVWTKGYGVTRKGGTTPVTPYTLFLAGSISKPVAAVAALSLVERGSLTLDRDVNAQLRSWHVPENEFDRT